MSVTLTTSGNVQRRSFCSRTPRGRLSTGSGTLREFVRALTSFFGHNQADLHFPPCSTFEQASPHRISAGDQVDLSDLHVKKASE